MEARMGNPGRREFIQVLRLMENFHQHQVEQAVGEAVRLGAISFDAVKMLLLARLENRPARLDLTFYPYLPAATVGATDPRAASSRCRTENAKSQWLLAFQVAATASRHVFIAATRRMRCVWAEAALDVENVVDGGMG